VYIPSWIKEKKGENLTDEDLKVFAEFGFQEDLSVDY